MLYPLRFKPIFRRYIWGGRNLAEFLDKPIGDEACAESWEVVDHAADQSIVESGALQGRTLHSLVNEFGSQLLGPSIARQISANSLPGHLQNRFPLLLKFLDANRELSVQVHPGDEMASRQNPPDLGKTEAWYVLHAEPDAKIFAGLKRGVTRQDFQRAVDECRIEECLHSFEPKSGDCVFIRAGTIHAIGAGLLIAEIQQSSDTTFRVFDWNRVDSQGQSRDLHVAQAMQAIDFQLGPVSVNQPIVCRQTGADILVECDQFAVRRWRFERPIQLGDGTAFRIIAVTRGSVLVDQDPSQKSLSLGQSMLLPAVCESVKIHPQQATELLEIHIPPDR